MRPAVDDIPAPPFPRGLPWANVAALRMDQQVGRPVLVEFWDFCRVNSLRTLPYLCGWHRSYSEAGLRVIGVHASGFPPSAGEESVREAVARLGIPYPVVVDVDLAVWERYGNAGWPARYLFNQRGTLGHFHYGEGAYQETERAIQELLGLEREPMAVVRAEDDPDARIVVQTPDQPGAYSGAYGAGAVWAVLDGLGSVCANGAKVDVDHPGCYPLIEHEVHTEGHLDLELGDGVSCHAVCFTPGLATGDAVA